MQKKKKKMEKSDLLTLAMVGRRQENLGQKCQDHVEPHDLQRSRNLQSKRREQSMLVIFFSFRQLQVSGVSSIVILMDSNMVQK